MASTIATRVSTPTMSGTLARPASIARVAPTEVVPTCGGYKSPPNQRGGRGRRPPYTRSSGGMVNVIQVNEVPGCPRFAITSAEPQALVWENTQP